MGRAAPDVPDAMRGIHGRFARWRKSHTGRLPIPESLWSAAAEVAREHGVFRTSKVLSLEYGKLKRLAKESHPGGPRTVRLGGWKYRGRVITVEDVGFIRGLIAAHSGASRRMLSKKLCEAWGWWQPNGALCDMVIPPACSIGA